MAKGRIWTNGEIEYLSEHIGTYTLKTIAKNLNRTETACKVKAKRLKIGTFTSNTELITVTDASEILKIDRNNVLYHIKKGRLKVCEKKIGKTKKYFLNIDDVLKFAESYNKQKSRKWTDIELSIMKCMLRRGKSYEQIGEALQRTRSAVAHKAIRISQKTTGKCGSK